MDSDRLLNRGGSGMKEFLEKHLRPARRWTDQFLIAFFIVVSLIFLGQLMGSLLTGIFTIALYGVGSKGPAFFETGMHYGEFIGIWFVLVAAMCLPNNVPMLKTLWTDLSGNSFRMSLFGALLGFGINGLCILCSVLNHDLSLYFSDFNILVFLFLLLMVFIQSAAEEIVFRSYYYEKLRRRYRSPLFALLVNAIGFSLLHAGNTNMTLWGLLQCALFGILAGVLVHYYNSLWAAFWLHTVFNFTQSILFGLPNSGLVLPYSIYKVDAAANGFFFDVGNGVEGSPGCCILLAVVTVILVVIAKRRKLQPHDLWNESETSPDCTAQAQSADARL